MKKIFLVIVFAIFCVVNIQAQVIAFPGAEGFGKFSKGARASTSPTIYHVTNLNDNGTGSLRDAVSQPNRIVVFDVAGVIKITSRLIFSGNITVAGQTAPGDGITVYGNGVSFSGAKDVIVRYMRFRMGLKGDSGKDAAGIANGTDMIFDHCSITWGLDETFSISWDSKGSEPGNITIQNSIIGQGIMIHSAGGLIQTNGGVTLYKDLYIDNKTRNPKVKGLNQYVNNVVYNWGSGGGYILGDTEGSSWADIENNYFIKGPSTGGTDAFVRANQYFQIHQANNYIDYSTDGVLNGVLAVPDDFGPGTFVADNNSFIGSPKLHPEISNLLTAENAYKWIVDSVGPVIPRRDEVDKYVVSELTSLGTTGALINGEADLNLTNTVGNVFSAIQQPDADNDGIPDEWENGNGLNKNNTSDALTLNENGYLNIELYINSITSGKPFVKYPTLLGLKGIDTNFILLKWLNNAENSTEIVLEKSTNNTDFAEVTRLEPELSQYKIENLDPTTTYYFRLKTINESMESLYSDSFKATTLGVAAPPAVCTDPVPVDKSDISAYTQVQLQWSNVTGNWGGQLKYDVYIGTSTDNLISVATATTLATYTAQVLPTTQYFWRIDATNLLGKQEGDVWSFTTGKKPEREKVAYWALDETAGITAANDVQGAAISQNFTPTWSEGVINNAVTIPDSPTNAALVQSHYDAISLGAESFSVEMWFKSSGGAVDWYLIHKGSHVANTATGASGKWFGIQYNKIGTTDRLTWAIDDNATKTDLNVTGSTYFNNVWHHLVAIRDVESDMLKLYVDGVLLGSKTDGTGNITEVENIVIGNTNVNFVNAFGGSIDEVSIYKGVLTGEEVLENYNAGLKTGFHNTIVEKNMQIFPNPFLNELSMNLPIVSGNVYIEIYSLTGQLQYNSKELITNNTLNIKGLDILSSGAYIITVTTNSNQIFSSKIFK
ncbi:MAG: T9SS type A sorting domain-containing protein [Paludibacter sp.]|nr:T9SS type A sorting domain-containing protein [Paludibacter sp.]